MPTSGIVAGSGKSKEDVNYRQHEMCKTCMHFYQPNSCDVVAGNISTDAVCDLWAIVPPSGPKDGEYYINEYKKSSGSNL
jgi:hypothetical protein